jgi:hypothetical protein
VENHDSEEERFFFMQFNILRVKKAGYLTSVIPLIPLKSPSVEEDKGK